MTCDVVHYWLAATLNGSLEFFVLFNCVSIVYISLKDKATRELTGNESPPIPRDTFEDKVSKAKVSKTSTDTQKQEKKTTNVSIHNFVTIDIYNFYFDPNQYFSRSTDNLYSHTLGVFRSLLLQSQISSLSY